MVFAPTRDDPRVMLIGGLVFFAWGYLLVRYRHEIGGATGYYVKMYVSSRTPGWMLVPFGVLFMLGGGLVVLGSLIELICPGWLK